MYARREELRKVVAPKDDQPGRSELLNLISRNMQQSVIVYSLPISRVVGKEQCDGGKKTSDVIIIME